MQEISSKKMICIVLAGALLIAALISGCSPEQGIITERQAGTGVMAESASKADDRLGLPSTTASDVLEANIEIISFESDKKDYGSQEDIHFSALIRSSEDAKDITFIVRGIRPYNKDYISVTKTDSLSRGENDASFSAKTPYCTSGCGGVYPGEYQITLELFSGDELLASKSLAINLRR